MRAAATAQAAPSIGEAIERQRFSGSTAAQHQTTNTREMVQKMNAAARASVQASRDRGPIDPATGMTVRDMSSIDPDHVAGIGRVLSPAIRRATARVSGVFTLPAAHILALEQALHEEIAAEFWELGREYQVERDYNRNTSGRELWVPGPDSVAGAGDTVTGAAADSVAGAGGTVTSTGTVDQAGTVESTGTVATTGTAGA